MKRLSSFDRRAMIQLFIALVVVIGGTLNRPAAAHEIVPTIADFTVVGHELDLTLRLDVEALMAGMDLSSSAGGDSSQFEAYAALRTLPAEAISARFDEFWPVMADRISIEVDGQPLTPVVRSLVPPQNEQSGLARTFTLGLRATLPDDAMSIRVGWEPAFGPLVLRQNGVEQPYDGYLEPGVISPPISLNGGGAVGAGSTFLRYIPIGFDHIVPKGLDHILFILGLFLFNSRLRLLLLQVSAFTVAHTVTLAAAAANIVTVPSAIIEPAIAASIVFIAVENIYSRGVSRWRLPVVFGFGLLHGLGFASVLQEFGLPDDGFIAALLGFNLGVEFGQLAVIALAFSLVGVWFNRHRLYRALVVIPGSTAIGLAGAVWLFQRVG